MMKSFKSRKTSLKTEFNFTDFLCGKDIKDKNIKPDIKLKEL